MNIFVLDKDPEIAATYLLDKHVVKMPLESAQMLCIAYPFGTAPYKGKMFKNHPCSVWARTSFENYNWLIKHGVAACKEYSFRYSREHGCLKVIQWCKDNMNLLVFPTTGLTPFAQAVPEEHKGSDAVQAYRNYYLKQKAYIGKWTKRGPPPWWDPNPEHVKTKQPWSI